MDVLFLLAALGPLLGGSRDGQRVSVGSEQHLGEDQAPDMSRSSRL